MEKEHSIIPMVRNMRASGMKMFVTVMGLIPIQTTIPMRVNGKTIRDTAKECTPMPLQVCRQSIRILYFFIFFSLEAKYVGTWNGGRRQGPGELQFNQYRYVGKFHENYVRIE